MVASLARSVIFFFEMTDKIVVLSTCGSEQEAERLARSLVETRVAACVNILPGARSFYRWQGALESAEEWVLIIKSSRERFAELRGAIQKSHSYAVPEIVALPIVDGAESYLSWIDAGLAEGKEG